MKPDPKASAREIYKRLRKDHPDARIALDFTTPLELLVATVLSAQCTDVRVNKVTKDLFKKRRAPADYLAGPIADLENDIRSAGFFGNKAKAIRGIMEALVARHGGQVPDTMEELVKLPGVGRKTANVVLGNAFGKPGIPVDTHVKRVAGRIGLTANEDPVKIEYDLMELFPPKDWTQLGHTLIFHGRRICHSRKPDCGHCSVAGCCDFYAAQNG